MKWPSNPNAQSALFATIILFLATTILWYGALALYAHFPAPPESVGIVIFMGCSFLASPSFFIMYLLQLPPMGDRSIAIAIPITWVFYFALYRIYLGYRGVGRSTEDENKPDELT
jgi:hypothetical protein